MRPFVSLALFAFTCALGCGGEPEAEGPLALSSSALQPAWWASPLALDAEAGANALTVVNAQGLAPGDPVVIVQAAGARIATSADATYGQLLSLEGAGGFEFGEVASVGNDGRVVLASPLARRYEAASSQVVRVEVRDGLTVAEDEVWSPPPWNGRTGGVLALRVRGRLRLEGRLDVSGLGFRGGRLENLSVFPGRDEPVSTLAAWGAEKGESVAGDASRLDALGGRYGRGAPANGGGGGNAHNAGGGGGANLAAPGVGPGDGLGVPGANLGFLLDPELKAAGSPRAPSGGGRGGYTYSQNDGDAWLHPPGSLWWGGDRRRCVGGLGGHGLPFLAAAPRVFFGGGGGAGDANHRHGGAGGPGGGILFLFADAIEGAGHVVADGAPGQTAAGYDGDAPGGGGGGGTLFVWTGAVDSRLTWRARGGDGGLQDQIVGFEAEGPGGGGRGGAVLWVEAVRVGAAVEGGAAGVSNNPAVAEFPHNGATAGAIGRVEAVRPEDVPGLSRLLGPPPPASDAAVRPDTASGAPDAAAGPDAAPSAPDAGARPDADAVGPDAALPAPDAQAFSDAGASDAAPGPLLAPPGAGDAGSGGPRRDAGADASPPALIVTGGACAMAGRSSPGLFPVLAAAFWLFGRRRRVRRSPFLLLALASSPAWAAPDSFDAQRFRLEPEATGILNAPGDLSLRPGLALAHLSLGYASNPLVVRDGSSGTVRAALLRDRADGALAMGLGVLPSLAVFVQVPFALHQERPTVLAGTPAGFASMGVGDLSLLGRLRLLAKGPLAVVAGAALSFPTSYAHSFLGQGAPATALDLAVAFTAGRQRLTAAAQHRTRSATTLGDLIVDDEFNLRLGVARALDTAKTHELQASVFVATPAPGRGLAELPVEAAVGVAGALHRPVQWLVGAGAGLSAGWGVPDWRLFAGLRVAFSAGASGPDLATDRDRDGVPDARDLCPAEAEDRDGLADEDGCLETDLDQDGIADVRDRCPRLPETPNGLADEDGCPDVRADADGDRVPDGRDPCPGEPEDLDGFRDEDGCTDLDDDDDGVWDVDDACPRLAGLVTARGCPAPRGPRTCQERLAALAPVYFAFDEDVPLPASAEVLGEAVRILRQHPEIARVRVVGHTDARGSDAYNADLSRRRLQNVVAHLVGQGIDRARLSTSFEGEHAPAASNRSHDGLALNRRVTFAIEAMAPVAVSR